MKTKKIILPFILFLLFVLGLNAQAPAFPTAEGFGKFTTGGRGGKVVIVTNLDDYIEYNNLETPIPGSLRWALKQYPGEPITVVFRVSGIIKLKHYFTMSGSTVVNQNIISPNRSNITIAGQTAPGDGICISGGRFKLGGCNNIIIRNVRFRVGLTNGDTGTFIPGGPIDFENASNGIIDHCDLGWSAEENLTMYDVHYTTVQWCILHEGLYTAGHEKGERSYGAQWAGSPATFHHNLVADNVSRSIRFNGANNPTGDRNVLIDYINNINYNWGKVNSCYGGECEAGRLSSHFVNFVNNYYKPGPATPASGSYFFEQSAARSGYVLSRASKWYLNGNIMEGDATGTANNWTRVHNNTTYIIDSLKSDTLFYIPAQYRINYTTAQIAYDSVLAKVGAFPRDTVDRRIIHEVRTKTASGVGTVQKYPSSISGTDTTWTYNRYYGIADGIIDQPIGAGGYPIYNTYNTITDNDQDGMDDAWEQANGLDPTNPNDRNLTTTDGYTALEVYLDGLMGEQIPHNFSIQGLNNVSQNNITIYPTITKDFLNIKSEIPVKSICVLNLSGQKVIERSSGNLSAISVSSLPTGCYFVLITDFHDSPTLFKMIHQ